MIKESEVLKALGKVDDPDLKKDLVTLNMVKDISIQENKISFSLVLTTPACPLKEKIKNDCIEALTEAFGNHICIDIKFDAQVSSGKRSELLPKVKNIIAVASGKGGVGKSSVSSNIALSLSRQGATVGILDADIFGPSVPTMFGVENARPMVSEVEGRNLIQPIESHGVKIISMGFLSPSESAVVWRGPMASKALSQFLGDTDWGTLDYLFIDLPPGTSDIHLSLTQLVKLTGAIIVTTPQKVALVDAVKGIAMFLQPQINVPLLGLVENMAYFTPPELPDHKYYIFGQDGGQVLAEKYDIPFLGQIPIEESIRLGGDIGKPAVLDADTSASKAYTEIAKKLAQAIAIRNAN